MPSKTQTKVRREMSFVSLFSGCGGLDWGFQQAGFHCLGAYDNDANALATHSENLGTPIFQADLTSGNLPNSLGMKPQVVVAGSPCQGFSTIGKRVVDDKRNALLLSAGRIAVALEPDFFVAENVPAVMSGAHSKYWAALQSILFDAGYTCSTHLLKASDFGVAQQRRRLFMIASRNDAAAKLTLSGRGPLTVGDALRDLPPTSANHDPLELEQNSKDLLIARRIKPGQKLCDVRISDRAVHTWNIPEVYGETSKLERAMLVLVTRLRRRERERDFGDADPVSFGTLKRELGFDPRSQLSALVKKGYLRHLDNDRYDLTHTFNGKFRRLDPKGYSPTVDTRFGVARNFLHPYMDRALTVREAARLQGFPDDFRFRGSLAQQYRCVGNAVPPPMATAIARSIVSLGRDGLHAR